MNWWKNEKPTDYPEQTSESMDTIELDMMGVAGVLFGQYLPNVVPKGPPPRPPPPSYESVMAAREKDREARENNPEFYELYDKLRAGRRD